MPVAVVTGASMGIGKKLVEQLSSFKDEEWKIIMIARNEDSMKEIASKSSNCYIIKCDLSKPNDILNECIPKIKKYCNLINNDCLELLINNAGAYDHRKGSFKTCDLDSWMYHQNLNLTAPFLLIKHLLPLIIKSKNNKYKNIINISSMGSLRANKQLMAYCNAKNGLNNLTKHAALYCAKYKIRVNGIIPGGIENGAQQRIYGKKFGDLRIKLYKQISPLHTVGNCDDIIQSILYLMNSEKSRFITGQNIVIDGGVTLPLIHSNL